MKTDRKSYQRDLLLAAMNLANNAEEIIDEHNLDHWYQAAKNPGSLWGNYTEEQQKTCLDFAHDNISVHEARKKLGFASSTKFYLWHSRALAAYVKHLEALDSEIKRQAD